MNRRLAFATSLGLLVGLATRAGGNGRPPITVSTALEPAPGHRLLVGTTFGLLVSDDGGAGWRWICEPAIMEGAALPQYDPRYRVSSAGTFFATLPSGVSYSRDGGCSWQLAGGLAGRPVHDLAVSPVDAQTVFAATAATGTANGLFVSHDGGATFALTGAPDASGYYEHVVAVGPDAYVSGYDAAGQQSQRLWKYSGATGVIARISPRGLEAASVLVDLLAASQRTPGLLFLRSKVPTPNGRSDALFRSVDGGLTWTQVLLDEVVRAVVVGDEDTVWVATARGMRRSTDKGLTFEVTEGVQTYYCLGKRGPDLYACMPGPEWRYSHSRDGVSWNGRVSFENTITGTLSCPAGTPTHDVCEPMWPGLVDQLGIHVRPAGDAGAEAVDAAAAGGQGGAGGGGAKGALAGSPAGAAGGSGCSMGGTTLAGGAWLFFCAAGWFWARGRRRSRSR